MALGKIESIDPRDSQFGTITESETGDVYNYHDPLFAQKGLALGDTVIFSISYEEKDPVATDLEKYVSTERNINTEVMGPITSAEGETIRIGKGGIVRGGVVIINNSSLFVEDTGLIDGGDLTVEAGSNATFRKGGQIKGNININNGSLLRVINKGVVKGNIVFNSGNRLIIGNDNGGGTVTGSITTDKIKKLKITSTSVINCGA